MEGSVWAQAPGCVVARASLGIGGGKEDSSNPTTPGLVGP